MKNKMLNSEQLLSLNSLLNALKNLNVIKDFYVTCKSKHNIVDSYVSTKSIFKCESEWKMFYMVEDILVFDERMDSDNAVRLSIHT